jgi:signal transduction histidine kinase
MQELIEAMLDLSRVTRNELVCHELDLGLLARSVFPDLDRTLPLRQVEFSAPEGLRVRGDERMLRIALNNLIENAWKFTRHRDPARIIVGAEQGSEGPVYYVRDNGAGFDMAQADQLFKPFNRLHRDNDFPGTGIGLATVQRVIQRHGGRIWAESAPDEGATFWFTLPERCGDRDAPR